MQTEGPGGRFRSTHVAAVLHVKTHDLADGAPYERARRIAAIWLDEHDPAPF